MTQATPHVLLSAYQCAPGLGSVSQIGWEWFSRLSRRTRTTLVTHVRNQSWIEQEGELDARAKVVYIDTEWFAGPLYRVASRLCRSSEHALFMVASLDFFLYDRKARRTLRRHVKDGEQWDIVHLVAPITTAAPSSLWRLGAPTVWGPLNCGLRTPKGFSDILSGDMVWFYPLRGLGRLLDAVVGCARHCAAVLTATASTRESIPERYRARCHSMIENGVDLSRFEALPWPEPPSNEAPLRVLFVGRLIPAKGVGMLLKAIDELRKTHSVELTVVGDGPMRETWEKQVAALALDGIVTFTGGASLDDVSRRMRWCHVFCLSSVRESGGAVLLEAMASARPVIAVLHGGPGEIVDDEIGHGIAPTNSANVTRALGEALRDVIEHPDAWRARGEAGRRRAQERYDWEAKIDEAMDLYRRIATA